MIIQYCFQCGMDLEKSYSIGNGELEAYDCPSCGILIRIDNVKNILSVK